MKVLWCWRCKMDLPMLDENEYAEVRALYGQCMNATKQFREEHNVPLDAVDITELFRPVCVAYQRLTGMRETVANAVMHHRIALYGPPCTSCGRVLRTATASKCFECGHPTRTT
jgi:hypothetical protein